MLAIEGEIQETPMGSSDEYARGKPGPARPWSFANYEDGGATRDTLPCVKKVLREMEAKNISQEGISEGAGLSKNRFYYLRRGARPSEDEVVAMARVLDLDPDYLFDDEIPVPPRQPYGRPAPRTPGPPRAHEPGKAPEPAPAEDPGARDARDALASASALGIGPADIREYLFLIRACKEMGLGPGPAFMLLTHAMAERPPGEGFQWGAPAQESDRPNSNGGRKMG